MVFSPFQLFLRWTLVSTASDMPLHLLEFVFLPGRYFLIIEKISGVCRKFATARKNVSRGSWCRLNTPSWEQRKISRDARSK
jgi:hypothetical protein